MTTSNTRNLSIVAHIDHGKTTLTDRMMVATNTITPRQFHDRLLDSNPIEQERGITIKLAPVTMTYTLDARAYTINLIDTPGHVDFGYEVERSLAAGEGAVLLIDATQGIQAQTLTNYEKARRLGLKIIPVLNKIDLPAADLDAVSLDIIESFGLPEADILRISAKSLAFLLLPPIPISPPAPSSLTPLTTPTRAPSLLSKSMAAPSIPGNSPSWPQASNLIPWKSASSPPN